MADRPSSRAPKGRGDRCLEVLCEVAPVRINLSDQPEFLPAGASFDLFLPSGSIRGTRNDVALVEGRDCRYVIAMMSRDCNDRRFYVDNEAAVLLADVSALIYGYFGAGRGRK